MRKFHEIKGHFKNPACSSGKETALKLISVFLIRQNPFRFQEMRDLCLTLFWALDSIFLWWKHFVFQFSPEESSKTKKSKSAVFVVSTIFIQNWCVNLRTIEALVWAVGSDFYLTRSDTFKLRISVKTVHRISRVSALANFCYIPCLFPYVFLSNPYLLM